MSSQESPSRGGGDKNDHTATLDGGLRMKIMRAKALDGSHESKSKAARTDSNGLQADPKSNIGTPSSTKNKTKEVKTPLSVQCNQPPVVQTGEMFAEGSTVGIPTVAFNTKNIPISNLFSTQAAKYLCRQYSSLSTSPEVKQANEDTIETAGSPTTTGNSQASRKSPENGCDKVQSHLETPEYQESPPTNKKRKNSGDAKVNRCVGTSFGTLTEPEFLGPCEPGTSVNLDGIVWHETEDGILVVNATWRGRSYVGTLLDSTRHDWAPPRPNDGNEDWDCRTRAGRAKRRNASFGPEVSSSSSSKTRNSHHKSRAGRESQLQDGTSPYQARNVPPRAEIRKSKDELSSNDESSQQKETQSLVNPVTGLQVQIPNSPWLTVAPCPVSPVLLECPDQDCSKKYKNLNGLRYHQSRVHGADCFDDDSMHSIDSCKTPSPRQDTLDANNCSSTNKVEKNVAQVNGTSSSTTFKHDIEMKNTTDESRLVSNNFSTTEKHPNIGKHKDDAAQPREKDETCNNDEISSTSGLHEPRTPSSGVEAPTIALLSVKKDIFQNRTVDQSDLPSNKKEEVVSHKSPFKLLSTYPENFCSILDGARSPAYSDISDDSLSFSSADFIDKLLKSTESKNSQQGLGGSFDMGFQLQNKQQYSILNQDQSVHSSKPTETDQSFQCKDKIQDGSNSQEYTQKTSGFPGQCNTTSSTFINPYNLVNSSCTSHPSDTTGDFKNHDIADILPSKKENTYHKIVDAGETPDKTSIQTKLQATCSANISSTMASLSSSVQNTAMKSEKEINQTEKPQINSSQNNHANNARDRNSRSPPQFLTSVNPPKLQPSHMNRPPSNNGSQQQPLKTEQKRNASQTHQNRSIKEEKNIKIKQEPQMPAMSGPHQYIPQPQYMNSSYPFGPAFPPYQNSIGPSAGYSMPYFNAPLPRYSLPSDQSKQSNMTPQYVPQFGAGNFSAPNTLSGFSNTQTSPTSTMANANSTNRLQTGLGNGRPQTHFHTHHHTHVGLGYPVYPASYEAALLPGQQGTPSGLAPYSPRPAK